MKALKRRVIHVDTDKRCTAYNHITGETIMGPQDALVQRYLSEWMTHEHVNFTVREEDHDYSKSETELVNMIVALFITAGMHYNQSRKHLEAVARDIVRLVREP